MKSKTLNLLLILTSLIGYLEWGGGTHTFLFQAEYEILAKLFNDPESVFHPFVLLPLFGQLLLLITLFQKQPGRLLSFLGIGTIGLLLVFMFVIGLLGMNFKILGSTLPFMATVAIALRHYRKQTKA